MPKLRQLTSDKISIKWHFSHSSLSELKNIKLEMLSIRFLGLFFSISNVEIVNAQRINANRETDLNEIEIELIEGKSFFIWLSFEVHWVIHESFFLWKCFSTFWRIRYPGCPHHSKFLPYKIRPSLNTVFRWQTKIIAENKYIFISLRTSESKVYSEFSF